MTLTQQLVQCVSVAVYLYTHTHTDCTQSRCEHLGAVFNTTFYNNHTNGVWRTKTAHSSSRLIIFHQFVLFRASKPLINEHACKRLTEAASGFRSEQKHGCERTATQQLITLTLSPPVVVFRRQEVCVRQRRQCCEAGSAGLVCGAQRYGASFRLLKAADVSSLVSTSLF